MLYYTHKLLDENQVSDFRRKLIMSSDWVDGALSATGQAKLSKRNLQLNNGETKEILKTSLVNIILRDQSINSSIFPEKVFNILFSRTGVGMFYGPHVDVAFQTSGRRDLSFTLFLNNTNEYKGGELILYIPPEKKQIKLNPGEMIIYPTKYLHEVKEVTEGERMVCVGWIQSQIPRDDDRESLYELNLAISEVISAHGRSAASQKLNTAFHKIYKRFLI